MKIKSIIKIISFIIIFFLIFSYLSEILCRKTIGGPWNYTEKISGFYNSEKNEYDVMFFGSSNTYCSFNPLVVYDEAKIKSYVLATQLQPMWATYTYMKEALKTQKPKLIVLDVLMFSYTNEYSDEGVNHSFIDDLPLSENKIELAMASAPTPEERFTLLCNFTKYHSRWNELTSTDFTYNRKKARDYLKGYVLLEGTAKDAPLPDGDTEKTSPPGEKQMKYFYKIVNLAKEENIPLLLVKTPSNVLKKDQMYYNSVKLLAEKEGIPFIDYNQRYEEIGLDVKEHFYDKSHLNYKGAEKFTRFFTNEILGLYPDLPSDDKNNTNSLWDADLKQYYDYCMSLEK